MTSFPIARSTQQVKYTHRYSHSLRISRAARPTVASSSPIYIYTVFLVKNSSSLSAVYRAELLISLSSREKDYTITRARAHTYLALIKHRARVVASSGKKGVTTTMPPLPPPSMILHARQAAALISDNYAAYKKPQLHAYENRNTRARALRHNKKKGRARRVYRKERREYERENKNKRKIHTHTRALPCTL